MTVGGSAPDDPRPLTVGGSRGLALVTGATGFIGSHLVPALERSGWQVRATGRRARPEWLAATVDYRPVDLAGNDDLRAVLEGVTHVFHLAGASSSLADQEEMHRANVVGTGRLLDAVQSAAPHISRFVHMSSTSVYGEEVQLPSPVIETVEPQPSRGYGKAKWGAEQEVWKAVVGGLPAVVLRPVTVYGPGNVKLLASAILDTAIEAFAGLDRLAVPGNAVEQRLLHIDDLIAATIHVAAHEEAPGRAFNVVLPTYPTSHDLASIIAGHIGLTVELTGNAEPGLSYEQRVATHERMVEAGMQPHILLTEERFRLMRKGNRNNRLSVDALLSTGFTFTETDLDASIDRTIAWYRDRHWLL